MSRYKALALDIDGTLLNTKKEVTPEVLKEVRRLQEESVPVMIASGRPHEGICHVAKAAWMCTADSCFHLTAERLRNSNPDMLYTIKQFQSNTMMKFLTM